MVNNSPNSQLALRNAITPITNTMMPNVIAVTMSTAWTQKNDVGALDHASADQARSSRTIARANLGQTTTLKTPARINSTAANFEITSLVNQEIES